MAGRSGGTVQSDKILILTGAEVAKLLEDREHAVIEMVRAAYDAHFNQQTCLPHSLFLKFPENPENRIIALPAYVGVGGGTVGMKWISSFPANVTKGIDRASGIIILNSLETGRPVAVLEGSIISAKRTAASAVLAASLLVRDHKLESVALIGCGRLNFEIQRFFHAVFPSLQKVFVYDLKSERAQTFAVACMRHFPVCEVEILDDLSSALGAAPVISIATTAARPYIHNLDAVAKGGLILHTSLRDLAPEVILACDNVVDDSDHANRAQTSIHLATQKSGRVDFIRCTLAEVSAGCAPAKPRRDSITVFSPFGLGILDIAVAQNVSDAATRAGIGTWIDEFFPQSWFDLSADQLGLRTEAGTEFGAEAAVVNTPCRRGERQAANFSRPGDSLADMRRMK